MTAFTSPKNISGIYTHYKIMPSLQLHMLRVAAVAQTICGAYDEPLKLPEIISACLLHDMGNILKSDFEIFPDFVEPEGREYWEKVKSDFTTTYGQDVHQATMQIATEIGVCARTIELVESIGFQSLGEVHTSDDWAQKICEYADARVMPRGIASLRDRWADLEVRYGTRYPALEEKQRRQYYVQLVIEIEQSIFAHCSITPDEITEVALNDTIKSLENFVVR